jgi:hypothetical protein
VVVVRREGEENGHEMVSLDFMEVKKNGGKIMWGSGGAFISWILLTMEGCFGDLE